MPFPQRDTYNSYDGTLVDRAVSNNAATDLPAESLNQAKATLAAATNTSFQAYLKWDFVNGIIAQYYPAWDVGRTNPPALSSIDVGQYIMTFPTFYYDLETGDKQVLRFNAVVANPNQLNNVGTFVTCKLVAPNQFYWYVMNFGNFTESFQYVDFFIF